MYNYCTLFDSNYVTRGLAMYESLKRHSDNFHLYIFAFDERCYVLLKKLNLKSVTVIALKEFEDEALLGIKNTRSAGEYCWTCTPSIIKFAIEMYSLQNCTYLDADLYFFANPSILIEEMGEKSVLITEHRYTPKYDQSSTSGIYCVQFMTFKNDANGMKVLNWWRNACNAWCYSRHEDGKFGDQKYLDDWTARFEGVHVLQHLGGGVAPWNIQQYKYDGKAFDLVFYHFHGFKFFENNKVELGSYRLRESDLAFLYKPYVACLEKINARIGTIDKTYDYHGSVKSTIKCTIILRNIKRWFKGAYNVYTKDYILGL